MECLCAMDINIDDADAPNCLYQNVVKAAKPHICGECGRTINIAERYEYCSGIWVGEFYVNKTCSDCLSFRKEFFERWCFEELWSDFKSNMDECNWQVPESCLSRVTPAARARICEMIENYWEEE